MAGALACGWRASQVDALRTRERAALAAADAVVVTSAATAADVTADYEPVFLSAFGIGTQQVSASARVRVVKALEGKEQR